MLGNFKVMIMTVLLFFAKMLVASRLKALLVGLVGLTTSERFRKMGMKEFKSIDLINLAFFMGICFTYVNKYIAEKLLTRIFVV